MWTSLSWPHLSPRSCPHWLLLPRNIPLEGCTCCTVITVHLQSRSAGSGHYIDALFTLIVQQINEFWLIPVGRLDLYRFATSAIFEVFTALVLRIQGFFVVKQSTRVIYPRRFEETFRFCLQGSGWSRFRIYVPSNRPQSSVTTRQTSILSRHCCL
jgi:hypothetical protein